MLLSSKFGKNFGTSGSSKERSNTLSVLSWTGDCWYTLFWDMWGGVTPLPGLCSICGEFLWRPELFGVFCGVVHPDFWPVCGVWWVIFSGSWNDEDGTVGKCRSEKNECVCLPQISIVELYDMLKCWFLIGQET